MYQNFPRAKILSYDKHKRTARVHIHGKTDGASNGLLATFAYPVGDDDLDTEREILAGAAVYIFFEGDDEAHPVIFAYSSHGEGALEDIRRIRQENIEILARTKLLLDAPTVHIRGHLVIDGDITHTGDQTTTGTVTATKNVMGGGKSLKDHLHGGVQGGNSQTSGPV